MVYNAGVRMLESWRANARKISAMTIRRSATSPLAVALASVFAVFSCGGPRRKVSSLAQLDTALVAVPTGTAVDVYILKKYKRARIAYFTEERAKHVLFSESYYDGGIAVAVRR